MLHTETNRRIKEGRIISTLSAGYNLYDGKGKSALAVTASHWKQTERMKKGRGPTGRRGHYQGSKVRKTVKLKYSCREGGG